MRQQQERKKLLARSRSGGDDMFAAAPSKSAAKIKAEAAAQRAREAAQAEAAVRAKERADAAARKAAAEASARAAARNGKTLRAGDSSSSGGGSDGSHKEKMAKRQKIQPKMVSTEEAEAEYARLRRYFPKECGEDFPPRQELSPEHVEALTYSELQDFLALRSNTSKIKLLQKLWTRMGLKIPPGLELKRSKKKRVNEGTVRKEGEEGRENVETSESEDDEATSSGSDEPAEADAASNAAAKVKRNMDRAQHQQQQHRQQRRTDQGEDDDDDASDLKLTPGVSHEESCEEEQPEKEEELLDLNDPDVIRMLQGGLRVRKRVTYNAGEIARQSCHSQVGLIRVPCRACVRFAQMPRLMPRFAGHYGGMNDATK